MPWSYRRSRKVGPFRINFSKGGIGYSAGNKYYRAGKTARGQRYVSSSPVRGLRYRQTTSSRGGKASCLPGCLLPIVVIATTATRAWRKHR